MAWTDTDEAGLASVRIWVGFMWCGERVAGGDARVGEFVKQAFCKLARWIMEGERRFELAGCEDRVRSWGLSLGSSE